MSVKEELTIAVLMRFVLTPKDPITAHVLNQDMKGTEIIAQVIFFRNLVILHAIESIFFRDIKDALYSNYLLDTE